LVVLTLGSIIVLAVVLEGVWRRAGGARRLERLLNERERVVCTMWQTTRQSRESCTAARL
jgi:hypothetical protein